MATEDKVRVIKLFLVKFKEEVTEAQKEEFVNNYVKIVDTDPFLTNVQWGTDLQRQNFDRGYTHAFYSSFDTLEADDAFVAGSGHINFSKKFSHLMDSFIIIDYHPSFYQKPPSQ